MAKMTVAKAKKNIIAQIKRRKGLFENIGQKELGMFEYGAERQELNEWIESLDYDSIKQYL